MTTPNQQPVPKPQSQPPATKPDPAALLAQQAASLTKIEGYLKRIDDNLNFIKSFMIIVTILYVLDAVFTYIMSMF